MTTLKTAVQQTNSSVAFVYTWTLEDNYRADRVSPEVCEWEKEWILPKFVKTGFLLPNEYVIYSFNETGFKKGTLFECQCILHESANWRHYILRLLIETGPPFYVVIRATRRSSRLQGKGSTFISQLF